MTRLSELIRGESKHSLSMPRWRAMTDGTFIFEERGTTDIKSIGPARTFFLVGDQQSLRH